VEKEYIELFDDRYLSKNWVMKQKTRFQVSQQVFSLTRKRENVFGAEKVLFFE